MLLFMSSSTVKNVSYITLVVYNSKSNKPIIAFYSKFSTVSSVTGNVV